MAGIYRSDDWFVGRGTANGDFLLIRARTGLPSPADQGLFNTLITATWTFELDPAAGMPWSELLDQMEEFETVVLDACDRDGWWGCGVGVVTTPGKREWRFYTSDPQAFVTEFSEALHGLGPYPIQLMAEADPEWTGLRELL